MPNQIRLMADRLNKSVTSLLNSSSHRNARLPIIVSLANTRQSANFNRSAKQSCVKGVTKNFNQNDISFVIPVIRLDENYLAGHEEKLLIEISVPTGGAIMMLATAIRYERSEHSLAICEYLVTARIDEIAQDDRERFADFLKNGDKAGQGTQKTLLTTENPKPSLANQFFSLF
jgi:hypothetical protein